MAVNIFGLGRLGWGFRCVGVVALLGRVGNQMKRYSLLRGPSYTIMGRCNSAIYENVAFTCQGV